MAVIVVLSGCAVPVGTPEAVVSSKATASSTPIATATSVAVLTTPATRPIGSQHAYSITLQSTSANGAAASLDLNYLLYLPDDYGQDSQRRWPLILFLHGAGQRGDDVEKVAQLGLPDLLNTRLKLPALVVSPQLPSGAYWNDYVNDLEALLDQMMAKYAIDPKRVYVTGFSMGGYGTWALGLNSPDRFAALAPVAGGWDASAANLCALKAVPVWVLHGANDEMVVPSASEEMVKALQACGGNVRFTLLPKTTHAAAATVAYLQPGFFDWLLAQQLP
jgi:predicted peptidase